LQALDLALMKERYAQLDRVHAGWRLRLKLSLAASWGLRGAESVLRLRSLRSSGDFDDYWRFHLEAEHHRNHDSHYAAARPARPALRVIKGGASS